MSTEEEPIWIEVSSTTNWNKRFVQFMKKVGMENSNADPYLFHHTRNGNFLYIAIYVDDGIVVRSSDSEIQSFLELLQREFKITMDNLETFLVTEHCSSKGWFNHHLPA